MALMMDAALARALRSPSSTARVPASLETSSSAQVNGPRAVNEKGMKASSVRPGWDRLRANPTAPGLATGDGIRPRLVALAAALALPLAAASAVGAAAAVSGPSAPRHVPASSPCGKLRTPPHSYRHVVWVWMENHSYNTIIRARQAPYINKLATRCGLAANYHNISHPSLPNYIAATSGLGYARIAN